MCGADTPFDFAQGILVRRFEVDFFGDEGVNLGSRKQSQKRGTRVSAPTHPELISSRRLRSFDLLLPRKRGSRLRSG